MSRASVVGLEIDASGVSALEVRGGRPRSSAFVPLPAGTFVGGDVADAGAITDALGTLRRTARFGTRSVVVGLPASIAVVRRAVLPDLPIDDLRKALRYELADLVPFAAADAVADVQEIEPLDDGGLAVLVVAAPGPQVEVLASAVRAAGYRLRGLDFWPIAIMRAVGPRVDAIDGETEVVVHVTTTTVDVAVHTDGVVRFARSIVLDAQSSITGELEAELARIERFRQRGTDTLVAEPAAGTRRDPVVDAVRGTLDYYSFQSSAPAVTVGRVAGPRADAVAASLVEALRIPFDAIDPVGEVSGTPAPRAVVGLGLARGIDAAARLELRPESDLRRRAARSRRAVIAASAAAGLMVAAGLTTVLPDAGAATAERDAATAALQRSQAELATLAVPAKQADELRRASALRTAVTAGTVDWPRVIEAIVAAAPEGTEVLAIQGTRSAPGAGAPTAAPANADASAAPAATTAPAADGQVAAASSPVAGASVAISIRGADQSAVGRWLTALGQVSLVRGAWPGTATNASDGSVTFSISADLTAEALSAKAPA